MAKRDLIVIGGSAGAIGALSDLLAGLPATLDASVAVVLHRSAQGSSGLEGVLSRASSLPAAEAVDGEMLQPGRVYLAPADRHLLVHDDHLLLVHSAKVNLTRPAVDPLFQSAARWYGAHAIGVVLSGSLDDGSVGYGHDQRQRRRVPRPRSR
jgi:two-component system, chemotaxis family, protein-glutamate methylesterase/glutaminase